MRYTTHVERTILCIGYCIVGIGVSLEASPQPENLRPGHSYYSDELAEPTDQGLVRSFSEEKNYEEVYQFYTYYEFVYDEGERVALFREYKRGEVIRTEEYSYDESGSLTKRVVSQPGKEDEVMVVDATGLKPPSERIRGDEP